MKDCVINMGDAKTVNLFCSDQDISNLVAYNKVMLEICNRINCSFEQLVCLGIYYNWLYAVDIDSILNDEKRLNQLKKIVDSIDWIHNPPKPLSFIIDIKNGNYGFPVCCPGVDPFHRTIYPSSDPAFYEKIGISFPVSPCDVSGFVFTDDYKKKRKALKNRLY